LVEVAAVHRALQDERKEEVGAAAVVVVVKQASFLERIRKHQR
jgi:hypothetical protein